MPKIPDVSGEAKPDGRRLALNLFDLTDRCDPSIQAKVGNLLDADRPLRMDFDRKGGEDEVAVAFNCDLLRAATICDLLRSHDREAGDRPIRLYLFRKSWSRIPGNVVLTRLSTQGKAELNPDVFSEAKKELMVVSPELAVQQPKRIKFGR